MEFSIIVAMDKNWGIGKRGQLPWHVSADMKHFAEITKQIDQPDRQNAVIMGRKTWESLPDKYKPLPGRVNVVLTRDNAYETHSLVVKANSLDEALKIAAQMKVEKVFVIGGGQIFEHAIAHPNCRKLYVTEVQHTFDCDTFFPVIHPERFKKEYESEIFEEQGLRFRFVEYLPR